MIDLRPVVLMSNLELTLEQHLRWTKVPPAQREYQFAAQHVGPGPGVKKRLQLAGLKNWRFDFAWPEVMFAVEVEGGGWTGGRHTTGAGFRGDMDKYHHAMRLGWFIYRCDAELIMSGAASTLIKDLLKQRFGGNDERTGNGHATA